MRVHFISIGGSVMHNLAIALQKKGYQVSGSDDEIFEPARSRLAAHRLLPEEEGWHPERIDRQTDVVILGMHAKDDNPELLRALELGISIRSFPEFIYEHAKAKKRVVIAGSHGKTTICSMIMHVLRKAGKDFDYMVGSTVAGFDDSIKLTESAPVIVLEGDEYLSSALDKNPKFLWYKPHVAVISGIAWDHMNVFPTFDIYKEQFDLFIQTLEPNGKVFYDGNDDTLYEIISNHKEKICTPYFIPDYKLSDNKFIIHSGGKDITLSLSGSHNLLNLESAGMVCGELGISRDEFYSYISDFSGAGKRLEMFYKDEKKIIYRDFAHAPSKVKATISGVKQQYPGRKVIAFIELHTYSSLNPAFIPQYAGSTLHADEAFVYINEDAIKLKRMQMLSKEEVFSSFSDPKLKVIFETEELEKALTSLNLNNAVLLLMSSGNFGAVDLKKLVKDI